MSKWNSDKHFNKLWHNTQCLRNGKYDDIDVDIPPYYIEAAHKKLKEHYKELEDINYEEFFTEDISSLSPLAWMTDFVTQGHYPAPDVLLGLCLSFQKYYDEKGKLSLEEILFDLTGNKRESSRINKIRTKEELVTEILIMIQNGLSKKEAIEKYKEDTNTSYDIETIERLFNRHRKDLIL